MPCAELSDIRCYFELLGDGEPLLLIPGLGGTLRLWDPVAPELAQHFSCILADNRGMGRSIARRTPKSLNDYVSDLVELLDYLQLDKAHVLGVSLGGVIAQHLAIDHPSRVDRLVVVSSSNFFTPYLKQMALLLAQGLRHFKKIDFVRMMELLATSPQFHDANAELVEQRVKAKTNNVSRSGLATQLRCLACSDKSPEQYKIDAPTLVISGEFDPIIPSCYARKMASAIPDSRFEMIDGAGHNPLIDEPQRVVPMIVEFLAGRAELARRAGTARQFPNHSVLGRSECVAAEHDDEG
ncbi:MAG TPA: alpha/beta fold hydrolase [Humisphaera sp.]|jgi:pimeloyl-ACP methyl ester carboxylesterase|nr:alpha/beta fold hydrolase [Humisphaera sp.]